MYSYTYSIIIPHRNNPSLLNRLLDSIPSRQDIEIIVVDDNSSLELRPIINRSDVFVYYINQYETKGAGKARNLGIEKSHGKWLLFADCDDFYAKNFIDILDRFISEDINLLFFNCYYKWDVDSNCVIGEQVYSNSINQYLLTRKKYWFLMVKHIGQSPWSFMVKSDYVKELDVKFEEVTKGNDAYFHHTIAMNTNKIEVIPDKVYYWVNNQNSITSQRREGNFYLQELDHNAFLINLRIKAGAWNTIPSFFRGVGNVKRDCGFWFVFKYLFFKFFSDVPWIKVAIKKFWMNLNK